MTKKQDDAVGPIMGWSVGTGIEEKSTKELIEVPCVYSFKVIGEAGSPFQSQIVSAAESKLGRELAEHEIEVRPSSKGKYLSVTLHLYMTTLDEIYEFYAVLKANPFTRFIL